jgi:hypothetical protein
MSPFSHCNTNRCTYHIKLFPLGAVSDNHERNLNSNCVDQHTRLTPSPRPPHNPNHLGLPRVQLVQVP